MARGLASFPGSTPQLFIHVMIESWGVEHGSETNVGHMHVHVNTAKFNSTH